MLFYYFVAQNEDLRSIAEKFSSSEETIIELNSLVDNNVVGKHLLIYSEQKYPFWLCDRTVCFVDITSDQLKLLDRYYNERSNCDKKSEYNEIDEYKIKPDSENYIKEENHDDIYYNPEISKTVQQNDENEIATKNVCQDKKQQYSMIHIVQEGETLADIANKYGLTSGILLRCGVPEHITAGLRIGIPSIQGRRYFYTVKLGDTVESIASKLGCNKEKIIKTNLLNELNSSITK